MISFIFHLENRAKNRGDFEKKIILAKDRKNDEIVRHDDDDDTMTSRNSRRLLQVKEDRSKGGEQDGEKGILIDKLTYLLCANRGKPLSKLNIK